MLSSCCCSVSEFGLLERLSWLRSTESLHSGCSCLNSEQNWRCWPNWQSCSERLPHSDCSCPNSCWCLDWARNWCSGWPRLRCSGSLSSRPAFRKRLGSCCTYRKSYSPILRSARSCHSRGFPALPPDARHAASAWNHRRSELCFGRSKTAPNSRLTVSGSRAVLCPVNCWRLCWFGCFGLGWKCWVAGWASADWVEYSVYCCSDYHCCCRSARMPSRLPASMTIRISCSCVAPSKFSLPVGRTRSPDASESQGDRRHDLCLEISKQCRVDCGKNIIQNGSR